MPVHGGDTTTTALPRGRARFAALGYALRSATYLPAGVQQRLLGGVAGGVAEIPPVADLVRMVEALGGRRLPDASPTDEELFARDPALRRVRTSEPQIAASGAARPARLYRDPGQPARSALVWVHGGAFLGGDLDTAEAHWTSLALAARGIPVLSLTYRMAVHGSRYPDASDDVLAGWQWAVQHADALGVRPEQLHLGGASAGGHLVAGVAKRLRDGAGSQPASLVLAYPLVHAALPPWDADELARVKAAHPAQFTPKWVADLSRHYVGGNAALLEDPHAFAGNGDVSGLPPTLVLNNEMDTLRSSGEAFTEQLAASGVRVRQVLVPDSPHASLSRPLSPEGALSLDTVAAWLEGDR